MGGRGSSGGNNPGGKETTAITTAGIEKASYKKQASGVYTASYESRGTLMQANVLSGRENGKSFYTIRTGVGDSFKSSKKQYDTLNEAKKAAKDALKKRISK